MACKSVVATADNATSSLRSGRIIPAVPHFRHETMKAFYLGYTCAAYAGFVAFVVLNIAGHPEPLLFALLFLTIWPLAGIMAGYEPMINLDADYERKNGQKAPARWEGGFRDGLATGLVVSLISLLCLWQLERSLWLLVPPVITALLGPATGAHFSLKRLKKIPRSRHS